MANPDKKTKEQLRRERREHEPENVRKFVGPEGIEASDLPDKGRGDVFTDPGKEASRNLPQHHGGELGEEGGMRADRDISDADKHGHA